MPKGKQNEAVNASHLTQEVIMKRRNSLITLFTLFAAVVLIGCSTTSSAQELTQQTDSVVKTHPSRGEVQVVTDAQAQLVTSVAGATMNLDTEALEPGHAYTAWWVIVNKPEACTATPCTAKEVLSQTDALEADVGYAAGAVDRP
jgi:hypothetical protein